MKIYAIRHSLTQLNEEKKIQGRVDLPLSTYGITHAHDIFSKLDISVDIMFASPLIRAHQTAIIAAQYLQFDKPITLIQQFIERDFSSLDLLPVSESKSVVRGEAHLEGYESDQHLLKRVNKGLSTIKHDLNYLTGLIVCHAHVLKALLILASEKNISFADTIIMHDDLLEFELDAHTFKFKSMKKVKSDQ